jgi:hypothetical protein
VRPSSFRARSRAPATTPSRQGRTQMSTVCAAVGGLPSTWWPAGLHRVQHERQESTSQKLGPVCRWLDTCHVWYV